MKLIRDKIPLIALAKGETMQTHTARDAEYLALLKEKLFEEVIEFMDSESPEELADILEVVRAIAGHKMIPMHKLYSIRDKKRAKRGGFSGRTVWDFHLEKKRTEVQTKQA